MEPLSAIHALIALFAVLFIRIVRSGRREDGLPPGPPTIPILGNLHIFPTQSPYLQ